MASGQTHFMALHDPFKLFIQATQTQPDNTHNVDKQMKSKGDIQKQQRTQGTKSHSHADAAGQYTKSIK
ncbi:hypothetical protein I3842_15G067800 [Carya illinoinensis]|uniref:Uncharacterized protein n=1 Tax=Carya illinoinensis TaxID=32201 RepID=A0A922A6L2_CARIL|nr:hypothetical protein I3842_15G067800 [Carya illinoinensis]